MQQNLRNRSLSAILCLVLASVAVAAYYQVWSSEFRLVQGRLGLDGFAINKATGVSYSVGWLTNGGGATDSAPYSGSNVWGTEDIVIVRTDATTGATSHASYDGPSGGYSSGNPQGLGQDRATCVVVDPAGNVYVGGWSDYTSTSGEPQRDLVVLKFSATLGLLRTYRYPGSGPSSVDQAVALGMDGSGNLFVLGETGTDLVTIRLSSNLNPVWVTTYSGPATNSIETASAIAIRGGFVHVAATSNGNPIVIKYAATNGAFQWLYRWNDQLSGCGGESRGIAVDATLNVYLTARTSANESCVVNGIGTTKLSPTGFVATGWPRTYSPVLNPLGGSASPVGIVVDSTGNPIVGGVAQTVSTDPQDFLLLKYSPSGVLSYTRTYSVGSASLENAKSLAIDNLNRTVLFGVSGTVGLPMTTFATVMWDPNGTQLWSATKSGEPRVATGMAILNNGANPSDVFVAGHTTVGDDKASAVIRYSNPSP